MNRDDIIKMARKAEISIREHYDETGSTLQELKRFAALVAAAEREACARICEKGDVLTWWQCLERIRARGGSDEQA